jgi:putative membrane protein
VKKFLQTWLINTLGVLVAVYLVHGIRYQKPLDLMVASLLLGILNAILRPLLLLLALPVVILTLGLFTLVINAVLLYLISDLLSPAFRVENFRAAFWGAFVISLVTMILNILTGSTRTRIRVQRRPRPPQRPDRGGGDGPVIDI